MVEIIELTSPSNFTTRKSLFLAQRRPTDRAMRDINKVNKKDSKIPIFIKRYTNSDC